MGTHPIFESDFDCLTECFYSFSISSPYLLASIVQQVAIIHVKKCLLRSVQLLVWARRVSEIESLYGKVTLRNSKLTQLSMQQTNPFLVVVESMVPSIVPPDQIF